MRIINLDLERYGPFTGQKLTFQPGAKLHIVYGRNEAGKSCSLAAITDLFFGIDPRTRYDFLHEGKELRIGATIETRDGSRLAFQRRKGNKNTLLDTAGGALNDDALLPFLGSLSRAVFCHAFGLNTEKLREGAEEMLKSEGEVGASLFAAASGLRGLTDLRQSLESEADRIFAPRAAKDRIFYQALDRFETARKAIRELELKAGDWKARNERIEELGVKLAQIKEERRQKAVEQARLSRLKRVAPLLRLIDGDIETLGTLGDLPEFPASFTERLRDGLGALAEATDGSERAESNTIKQSRTFPRSPSMKPSLPRRVTYSVFSVRRRPTPMIGATCRAFRRRLMNIPHFSVNSLYGWDCPRWHRSRNNSPRMRRKRLPEA